MNQIVPQRYFVPELQREVMVEKISDNVFIAHVDSGPVRVAKYEMNLFGWVHRGPWEQKKEALTLIQYCRKHGHAWTKWFKNNRTDGEWKICKRCLDVETNEGVKLQ